MDASATATPKIKKTPIVDTGAHSVSALTIGAKLKEFIVTGIIGEGGFGIVYSADDTLLQRNVAIKEYMPAAIANRQASSKINLRSVRHQQTFAAGMQGFIDEARLLAQFKHPALVEILRFWEANGTAYMVMPHYSGKTLRNILKTSRNLCTERWLKSILGPVLDAIELLHTNHVYHRDIAPDNIVIQDTGHPVLLDLGSARRVIAGMQSALTVVVKPGYAPIEQYTEDTANEQGPWTDIYALGAVLYFAISGSAPAASVSRMMRDSLKLLNTDDHPHYSESFLSAINKALQLRPCDRFQSIADFRDALNIHTSLTGNIPLATLAQENPTAQENQGNQQHKDDEITLILSEDEISVFKEKLLKSLQPEVMNSQFNHNILINESSTKNDASISTFADVKDLIENKHHAVNNKKRLGNTTTNNRQKIESNILIDNKNMDKTQQGSAPIKSTPIKLPLAIGLFVLASIVLTVAFISTEENEIDVKTSEYAIEESHFDEMSLETSIKSPLTQDHSLSSAGNNAQYNDGKNLFLAPSESTIEQQEPQIIAEPNNTNSNQSTEASAEFETTQIPPIIDESENDLANNNPQPQNSDAKTIAKPIASSPVKTVESAAQAIKMGSIKVTLVPWGEIWINNQRHGVSPPLREILLAPGTYTIELRNPGLPSEIRTLHFNQGEKPVIYHNFSDPKHQPTNSPEKNKTEDKSIKTTNDANREEIKQNTSQVNNAPQEQKTDKPVQSEQPITTDRALNIKVIPWGEIYLDGKMAGVTPPLHQLTLTPGEHTIDIRHPSYTTKTIKISAEDTVSETLEHHFQ